MVWEEVELDLSVSPPVLWAAIVHLMGGRLLQLASESSCKGAWSGLVEWVCTCGHGGSF